MYQRAVNDTPECNIRLPVHFFKHVSSFFFMMQISNVEDGDVQDNNRWVKPVEVQITTHTGEASLHSLIGGDRGEGGRS